MQLTDTQWNAFQRLSFALQHIPESLLRQASLKNPWFEPHLIQQAAGAWCALLNRDAMDAWLKPYTASKTVKRIGIIMAGNIPMVGMHDLISAVVTGHQVVVKLSSDDSLLMQYAIDALNETGEPKIEVVERLNHVDAVIATGSNNTARIFESYFSHIPRVIRRNRTSIAVLTGNETPEELKELGKDIFTYFGLGCRNVSKVFVPEGYDFAGLFEAVYSFGEVINHNKYANNYEYNRAIYLLNSEPFLDNNFLMIRRDPVSLHSPLAVLYYDYYISMEEMIRLAKDKDEEIQCVVCRNNPGFARAVPFGKSQEPAWNDYADGVDTLAFLTSLS